MYRRAGGAEDREAAFCMLPQASGGLGLALQSTQDEDCCRIIAVIIIGGVGGVTVPETEYQIQNLTS